jgi:hypothetical protein
MVLFRNIIHMTSLRRRNEVCLTELIRGVEKLITLLLNYIYNLPTNSLLRKRLIQIPTSNGKTFFRT